MHSRVAATTPDIILRIASACRGKMSRDERMVQFFDVVLFGGALFLALLLKTRMRSMHTPNVSLATSRTGN